MNKKKTLTRLILSLMVLSLMTQPLAMASSHEANSTAPGTTTDPGANTDPAATTDPATTTDPAATTDPATDSSANTGTDTTTDTSTSTDTDVTEPETTTPEPTTKEKILEKIEKAMKAGKALKAAKAIKSAKEFKEKVATQGIGAMHKFTAKKHALGHLRASQNRKGIENLLKKFADKQSLTEWEKGREQVIAINTGYIRFLELLKRQLDSKISSGEITEVTSSAFLDSDISVMKAFNEAYASVTKEWIANVETASGEEIDENEFANQMLAIIGSVQVIYNAYVSAPGVIGTTGLLTAQANEIALEKQYTYVNVNFPEQVKVYGENVLKLSGDELTAFVDEYNARVQSEVVSHLDEVAAETDKAIAIFVNDITAVQNVGSSVSEFLTNLQNFVDQPTEETIKQFLDGLMNVLESIQTVTKTIVEGDMRASAEIRAITDHYKEAASAMAKIYADLAAELR